MSKIELIKSIRARTSLSFKDIQKAIDALQIEDEDKIIAYLREQGVLKAQARADRETSQGGIFSYIHDSRVGVMVMIKCETDFVSRGDAFKELGNDIALHIAATEVKFIDESEVDQEFIKNELEIAREQLINQGKPENMIDKILDGKRASIVSDYSLLSQPFLKDPSVTVSQKLTQISQETGEKIVIAKFSKFTINN